MFDDIFRVYEEIRDFKKRHVLEFSHELEIAVNISLAFAELVTNIKEYDNSHDVYIDEKTFFEFKKMYTHYLRAIKDDVVGIFDEWAKMFIYQHLNFAHMLLGNNINIDSQRREEAYRSCITYGGISLEKIGELEQMKISKENHDDRGLLSLLKAYVTRNLYISKKFVGDEDAVCWLRESVEERESLMNNYGDGTIDSKLYNNFCMEYYLALVSYIDEGDEEIGKFEIDMYKEQINDYLQLMEKNQKKTSYLQMLRMWVDK